MRILWAQAMMAFILLPIWEIRLSKEEKAGSLEFAAINPDIVKTCLIYRFPCVMCEDILMPALS